MSADTRHGFTLPEVMVVALLLTAGVGAIGGVISQATRSVHRGRQGMRQLEAGLARLEILRGQAASTPASCVALADGADSLPGGTTRRWRVAPSGPVRPLSVAVSVPVAGGRATDSLTTAVRCVP